MKYFGISIALLVSSVAVIGCGSDEEAQTALDEAELVELHELKPITGDDISQEEYEAALSLVDNESEDSRFQYSTDENEIALIEQRNLKQLDEDDPHRKMVEDLGLGGFSGYADFIESHSHDCQYLKEIHERYGLGYDDFSEGSTCVREAAEHPKFYDPGEPRPMRQLHEYIGLSTRDAAQKALNEFTNLRYVGVDIETHPVTSECNPGMFYYWAPDDPDVDIVSDARADQC